MSNSVQSFPEFVQQLPKGDYSGDDASAIRGFVVQGTNHQVVFNENDEYVEFKPHVHAESFGVVLSGWCELVIEGVCTRYEVGQMYRIPANTLHFARQSANYKDVVIFNEANRVPLKAE
ncbi:MAG: hypothetical protein AAGG51_22905 [Cyanobacteria bacterium P01_G01_bin.54]